jgi:hypothetical protein
MTTADNPSLLFQTVFNNEAAKAPTRMITSTSTFWVTVTASESSTSDGKSSNANQKKNTKGKKEKPKSRVGKKGHHGKRREAGGLRKAVKLRTNMWNVRGLADVRYAPGYSHDSCRLLVSKNSDLYF